MTEKARISIILDDNTGCNIHLEGRKSDMLAMTAVLVGKIAENIPKDIVLMTMLFAIENPPTGSTESCSINDSAIRDAVTRFKKERGSDT